MNNIAFIAFTRKGCLLAQRLADGLSARGADGFSASSISGPARFADELGIRAYDSLSTWTEEHFANEDALVYVGATGIAVRAIAPYVRDKFHDPAVVSIDEGGAFAVPLLSGHVGGANELARAIATVAGAQAVVSTATDVNGLFAVDEWAARNNLAIVERSVAKEVSAALLEGRTVGFYSDMQLDWEVPAGVVAVSAGEGIGNGSGGTADGGEPGRGIAVGFTVSLDDAISPFARTLHLVPRVVTVGVGCRKGCDPTALEEAVATALEKAHVSRHAITRISSIDVKRGEPAIEQLAEKIGCELRFYTSDELETVPGEFAASDFVKRTVGVDNVCERSALAEGGTLLLGKQAGNGVTVAIAAK